MGSRHRPGRFALPGSRLRPWPVQPPQPGSPRRRELSTSNRSPTRAASIRRSSSRPPGGSSSARPAQPCSTIRTQRPRRTPICSRKLATAMPTVSSDGLTYTFHIRDDYAFSPPASGVVTAASMKYTFERTLAPAMASPAIVFYSNIVGATAYNSGSASHISGIVAAGDTLTFTLVQPQGEFMTLLALPFACAVPTTLPMTEAAAPVPTAGPYYVSEHVYARPPGRAPEPELPRASSEPLRLARVLLHPHPARDPPAHRSRDLGLQPRPRRCRPGELAQLYGPDSAAAGRGFQQWYSNPLPCTALIPLNTERPLFATRICARRSTSQSTGRRSRRPAARRRWARPTNCCRR